MGRETAPTPFFIASQKPETIYGSLNLGAIGKQIIIRIL